MKLKWKKVCHMWRQLPMLLLCCLPFKTCFCSLCTLKQWNFPWGDNPHHSLTLSCVPNIGSSTLNTTSSYKGGERNRGGEGGSDPPQSHFHTSSLSKVVQCIKFKNPFWQTFGVPISKVELPLACPYFVSTDGQTDNYRDSFFSNRLYRSHSTKSLMATTTLSSSTTTTTQPTLFPLMQLCVGWSFKKICLFLSVSLYLFWRRSKTKWTLETDTHRSVFTRVILRRLNLSSAIITNKRNVCQVTVTISLLAASSSEFHLRRLPSWNSKQ